MVKGMKRLIGVIVSAMIMTVSIPVSAEEYNEN